MVDNKREDFSKWWNFIKEGFLQIGLISLIFTDYAKTVPILKNVVSVRFSNNDQTQKDHLLHTDLLR